MTDCVFCRIIATELPADVVAEDDEFLAFRDVQPRAKTHVLIVPKLHVDNLDGWLASGGSSDRMLTFVTTIAAQEGVSGRYRLITNVGEDAGQTVPHLHWHVLAGPRLPGF
ncbi:MAG: HIT domain-containing protein [Thermoleophilia bacterium]|nr:HIT domain-containing protein [Thermoleophilia bacterium]